MRKEKIFTLALLLPTLTACGAQASESTPDIHFRVTRSTDNPTVFYIEDTLGFAYMNSRITAREEGLEYMQRRCDVQATLGTGNESSLVIDGKEVIGVVTTSGTEEDCWRRILEGLGSGN